MDPARFDVTVQDSIVTLSGRPETDDVGRTIVEAVRHIPGVVAVRDRLGHAGGRAHPAASQDLPVTTAYGGR